MRLRNHRTRVGLAAGAAAILLATAGCAGGAAAPGEGGGGDTMEELSLLAPIPPSTFYFPAFVADALGYFEEEGIEFVYETIGEDVSMTSLVVNGQVEVAAAGGTEILQGLGADQPLQVVFDYHKHAAEGVVVPEDSPIMSMEELDGLTVGVASDEVRSLLAVALEAAGLSIDDVEVVNIGTGPPVIVNSLDSGAVHAYVGSVTDFVGLRAAGVELREITPDELAETPASSFTVTTEFAEANADLLERFTRAWAKGMHAGITNPEVVEVVMSALAPEDWLDEAVAQATLDLAIELESFHQGDPDYGALETGIWESVISQSVDTGDLAEPIPTESFLDDAFITAANDFDRAEVEEAARQYVTDNG